MLINPTELTCWIDQHIERERLMIARELHDELGQSVTAIRSIALSIAQRIHKLDPQSETAARLIADESSRLYDAMHGMIPRLTPLVLDNFGLADTLGDLVVRTRLSQPDIQIESAVDIGQAAMGSDTALTLYRAAQEGISNALRHGHARELKLSVVSSGSVVTLTLQDDGQGLAPDWSLRTGHYGLRWLAMRAEGVGGELCIEAAQPHGVLLRVRLPLLAPALERCA
jgi:two-component system, NarL family, sensor histidine kinase UhpB